MAHWFGKALLVDHRESTARGNSSSDVVSFQLRLRDSVTQPRVSRDGRGRVFAFAVSLTIVDGPGYRMGPSSVHPER